MFRTTLCKVGTIRSTRWYSVYGYLSIISVYLFNERSVTWWLLLLMWVERKQSISADLPERMHWNGWIWRWFCFASLRFALLGFVCDTYSQIGSVHYRTDSFHFLCERIEICRETAAFFNEVCQKSWWIIHWWCDFQMVEQIVCGFFVRYVYLL